MYRPSRPSRPEHCLVYRTEYLTRECARTSTLVEEGKEIGKGIATGLLNMLNDHEYFEDMRD